MIKELNVDGLFDTFYRNNIGTVIAKTDSELILSTDNDVLYYKPCNVTKTFELGDSETLTGANTVSEADPDIQRRINNALGVLYNEI